MIQPIDGVTRQTYDSSRAVQNSGNAESIRPFDELLSEALENTQKLEPGNDFTGLLKGINGFNAMPLRIHTLDYNFLANDVGIDSTGKMQVSDELLNFLADHEGFSATPYRGVDSQNLTVGFGHVIGPGESYTSITRPQALSLMRQDVQRYANSVNKEFGSCGLSQNQFDALVSFSYNLGANIWSETPKLTSDIKNGASAQTLREDFGRCSNCNGQFVQGLYNRRMDEWQMFCGVK